MDNKFAVYLKLNGEFVSQVCDEPGIIVDVSIINGILDVKHFKIGDIEDILITPEQSILCYQFIVDLYKTKKSKKHKEIIACLQKEIDALSQYTNLKEQDIQWLANLILRVAPTSVMKQQRSGTTTPTSLAYGVLFVKSTGAGNASIYVGDSTNNAVPFGTGTVTSVAATVPSVLSITGSPITTSGTLAIGYSGTALPVANGGTGTTTQFTTGSVVFADGSGDYAQDNVNLFWDETNKRLGVGTNAPAQSIHTTGNVSARHLIGNSGTPTVVTGAGAGSGGSLSSSVSGNDIGGTVTLTSGNGPTNNGIIATLTFNAAYSATSRVNISGITAASSGPGGQGILLGGTIAATIYPSAQGTTTFAVSASGTLAANTSYSFNYQVSQ